MVHVVVEAEQQSKSLSVSVTEMEVSRFQSFLHRNARLLSVVALLLVSLQGRAVVMEESRRDQVVGWAWAGAICLAVVIFSLVYQRRNAYSGPGAVVTLRPEISLLEDVFGVAVSEGKGMFRAIDTSEPGERASIFHTLSMGAPQGRWALWLVFTEHDVVCHTEPAPFTPPLVASLSQIDHVELVKAAGKVREARVTSSGNEYVMAASTKQLNLLLPLIDAS